MSVCGGLTAGQEENRPRPDRLLINGRRDRLVMELFVYMYNNCQCVARMFTKTLITNSLWLLKIDTIWFVSYELANF